MRHFAEIGPRAGHTELFWLYSKGLREPMSYELIDVFQQIAHPRILVIGDVILDRYIWGEADRISQEAPVILLREERQERRLGGAGNVANLLRGLDTEVAMAGVVGNDADGQCVRDELVAAGVDCRFLLTDPTRPTTAKDRYLGRAQHRHPHQMLRVDREVRTPLEPEIESQFLEALLPELSQFKTILISDYAKGVCTPAVAKAVIAAARKLNIPVIVDPASSGECTRYHGATAVTPNRLETFRATGLQVESPEQAFQAGRMLCEQHNLDHAFVTLDSDGVALVRSTGEAQLYPTRRREVYDITGAGDMVLATIGLGAAEGLDPGYLARLANVAGGLEVEQIGVVRISREEILADLLRGGRNTNNKLPDRETLVRQISARKQVGQKIVLTNGCFDLLHVGHVTYLQQAKSEGDCLVVAVNSDVSVRRLNKGDDRPILDQQHRSTMLAALEAVDYVVVFDEDTPCQLLEALRPDVLVKGGTYRVDEIVGREIVESYGGHVKALGEVPGLSTTHLLERIRATSGPVSVPLPAIPRQPERKVG